MRDTETLELIPEEMLPLRRLPDHVRVGPVTVMIPIPPGSHEHQCTCGDFIFFAPYPTTKKPHPISLKHDLAIRPTARTAGQGVSHIPECPHRDFHLGKVKDRRFFDRRFSRGR